MKTASRKSHPRRGTALFLAVLSTAFIVALLGLAGLSIVRIERKQIAAGNDRAVATVNARSAIELAMRTISTNSNWRSTYTNGVETSPLSLGSNGRGTLSWILSDTDGDLTNADVDLRLKGVGRVGQAVQVSSIRLSSPQSVLDSLQCPVYAVGNITQSSNSTSNVGPFATGGTFTISGTVYGDVQGNPVNVTGTGTVTGSITSPGPVRTMPSPGVWDQYKAIATTIPYSNFTYFDYSTRRMERNVLGVTTNPFGSTDAEGVYYINVPAGQTLHIRSSRIHATLLIELGLNATFRLDSSCLWDPPAGRNYPAMIVKSIWSSDVELKSSNSTLKEASQPKRNFNPVGEPYNGEADSDENDQYLGICHGVYHIIGSGIRTTLSSNITIQGVLITEGPVTLGANVDVTLDPNIFTNPPEGYAGSSTELQAIISSWRRENAP